MKEMPYILKICTIVTFVKLISKLILLVEFISALHAISVYVQNALSMKTEFGHKNDSYITSIY